MSSRYGGFVTRCYGFCENVREIVTIEISGTGWGGSCWYTERSDRTADADRQSQIRLS
jgi:hypothetical protein